MLCSATPPADISLVVIEGSSIFNASNGENSLILKDDILQRLICYIQLLFARQLVADTLCSKLSDHKLEPLSILMSQSLGMF